MRSNLWHTECGQTDGQTDRKVKTERPMILSNDIFYFKTVIIGSSKKKFNNIDCRQEYIRILIVHLDS